MNDAIRVLIVDDEPAARRGVARQLAAFPDAAVAGVCAHGREAVSAIETTRPDLVFLDIQMPEMDGFEVIAEVGPERMPPVIFVTAYDQYALDAFNAHALDYLLKPIDDARFAEAFRRARRNVEARDRARRQQDLEALLTGLERAAPRAYRKRVVVKEPSRYFFLSVDDVVWAEAAGNYICLHGSDKKTHLIRETLTHLAETLDPDRFVRVSRAAVVNLAQVREIQPYAKGVYRIMMADGAAVQSSRGYCAQIRALLDNP